LDRYRETVALINLNHLYQNYQNVQKLVGNKTIIPVVKANAYGHGAIEVVRYLHERKVDQYAVSLLEEALELRAEFPDIKIMCMGVIEGEGLKIASKNDIVVTISNFDQIQSIPKMKSRLTVHLKVDTGMNRLGFKDLNDIIRAIELLDDNPRIHLEGIFTHFSTADNDKSYYDMQLQKFQDILSRISYPFEQIHISNSSSQIKYETNYDFTTHTRLGISLYGLTLDENMDFLKNTFTLKTKISQFKNLVPGEKVGYGATYSATDHERIGILPIGYADGFIRKNEGGDVEINGKRYLIIGRICMDQMFIKVDDTITKNDDVILMGGIVSIDEVAERLDTINYEIICSITNRVPREYIK